MPDSAPLLLSPYRLGSLELRNRLAAVPVFTGYALPDGTAGPMLAEHYWSLARSGPGLVVVGNAAVSPEGATSPHSLRLDHDRFIPGLARVAEAIRRNGAKACLQLNHAGRLAPADAPLQPSPLDAEHASFDVASLKAFMESFPFEQRFGLTARLMGQVARWDRGMERDDLVRVREAFATAAARAAAAGFDAVELHGASGYLLTQFLSGFSNSREDEYGGNAANRRRYPLEVLDAVRAALPAGFPVGWRLLLREWTPDGVDLAEALDLARELQAHGAAYLSATAGTHNSLYLPEVRRHTSRPGYLRQDSGRLKAAVGIPVIAAGKVLIPELAEDILQAGQADLIGVGRPLIADPDWLAKFGTGQKVLACKDCYHCLKGLVLGRPLDCVRWPRARRAAVDLEHRLRVRRSQGVLLAAGSAEDLAVLREALPQILPERADLHATLLFLDPAEGSGAPESVRQWFLDWARDYWKERAPRRWALEADRVRLGERPEETLRDRMDHGNFGSLLLPRAGDEPWRSRLPYLLRRKNLGLLGTHPERLRLLVAFDLSPSALLVLKFVDLNFLARPGAELRVAHVLEGPRSEALERWAEAQEVLGWNHEPGLELLSPRPDAAGALLAALRDSGSGTLVMGKRGLSGLKRWLLGSVSRQVLAELGDRTLYLID
jgi:2,4-dienoyl-CoA reductase (NADPH2)